MKQTETTGNFAHLTDPLVRGVQEEKDKASTPDPETGAFVSKLQEQRGTMPAAAFKAAMKAVVEMERSSQLLLCRQIAEAIAEALAPLNVPLTPGVPKRRLRKKSAPPAATTEQTPSPAGPEQSSEPGRAPAPSSLVESNAAAAQGGGSGLRSVFGGRGA